MYPGNAMASAHCSCRATFSRCAPGARPTTQQYLRPSRAPTTCRSLRKSTSWTTTAGDRVLGMRPLVSTRRTTTPPACNRSYAQGRMKTEELSFDVTLPADYNNFQQKFVRKMRDTFRDQGTNEDLVDPASGDVVAQIARLPPQVDTPDLMNLRLLAENGTVTLSVRTDNLYVVGFRNGKGRWFEFDHAERRDPMIQGSTQLRFDGRYDAGGIGELSAGDVILGREAVRKAIIGLSSPEGTYYYNNHVPEERTRTLDRDLKRFLRVLIVNFIESVKFDTIADRVANQLMSNPSKDKAQRRLDGQQILLIRNWGGLSHALMQAVNNPDPALRECYLRSFNNEGIHHNLQDVGRKLGMALVSTASRSSGCNVRPRCAIRGAGLTLAEVVEVVIRKLDGTITVTDGFSPSPLKLYDDHTALVAVWNPRDALSGDYNRILNGRVTRKNCDVEVQYAVLTDAVVANVEVVVVDADVDVYGSVTARTTMASGKHLQYSLLDKPAHVLENTAIPLQRKLVSAPLCSRLEVSANLWDHNETGHHEIVNNVSVVFTPRLTGTDTSEITGPNGNKVRVAVTWSVSLPRE